MSTETSVCGMSIGQLHEFAMALDKAGFNRRFAQRIVDSKGNALAVKMRMLISRELYGDDRFFSPKVVTFTVPTDYDHTTCLERFRKHQDTVLCDETITDASCFQSEDMELTPGSKYHAEIFESVVPLTSSDFLDFLRKQDGETIFAGPQGLVTLVNNSSFAFKDSCIVCLDDNPLNPFMTTGFTKSKERMNWLRLNPHGRRWSEGTQFVRITPAKCDD